MAKAQYGRQTRRRIFSRTLWGIGVIPKSGWLVKAHGAFFFFLEGGGGDSSTLFQMTDVSGNAILRGALQDGVMHGGLSTYWTLFFFINGRIQRAVNCCWLWFPIWHYLRYLLPFLKYGINNLNAPALFRTEPKTSDIVDHTQCRHVIRIGTLLSRLISNSILLMLLRTPISGFYAHKTALYSNRSASGLF